MGRFIPRIKTAPNALVPQETECRQTHALLMPDRTRYKSESPMNRDFESIFASLREILRRHSKNLTVTEDTPTRYTLNGGKHPTHKTPVDIAWIHIGKNYVSFHHMGVYGCERLRESLSPALKVRMQGESCFNFKKPDEALFKELDQMTVHGFATFRKAGHL